MAESEETKKQREKRNEERDLLYRTEDKLEAWAKRKFWWIAILAVLVFGLGQYGLVQSLLSTQLSATSEATVEARMRAKDAAEAAQAARAGALNAKERLKEIAVEVGALRKANKALQAELEAAQSLSRDLEEKLVRVESRSMKIETAQSGIEKATKKIGDTIRDIEARMAGIRTELASVRTIADPEDTTFENLIKQFNNVSLPWGERAAAASALADRGPEAETALLDLKRAWYYRDRNELAREHTEQILYNAVATAIVEVGGEAVFPFLLDSIMKESTHSDYITVHNAILKYSQLWSVDTVFLIRSRFNQGKVRERGFLANMVGWRILMGEEDFAKDSFGEALELLNHALEDTESTVVANAVEWVIQGQGAVSADLRWFLPALQKALKRTDLSVAARRSLEEALLRIKSRPKE